MNQSRRLQGIIPPLVTPLSGDDSLDSSGLNRLIEHVVEGGVHGIFLLGTTGEAPSLSYRLRRDYLRQAIDQIGGRLPVLVGVTDTSFVESMALANVAADCGADYVVLSTPYYFPAGQTELTLYIQKFVAESPLPVMLYNIPSMTKVSIEIETLGRLTENDKIVGVKDSSGDTDYFERLLAFKADRPDWSFFMGPEHLTSWAVTAGADGGVNGGANVYPDLFARLYDAVNSGAVNSKADNTAARLQKIVEAFQEIYSVGKYASRHIKATKSALSIKGICSDALAQPFNHFLAPERQRVAEVLKEIDAQLDDLS